MPRPVSTYSVAITPRSSQPTALCHSRTIARKKAITGTATPIMFPTFCAAVTGGLSGYGTDRLEGSLQRQIPVGRDRVRRRALLAFDALGHADRLLIARTLGDAPQLLVGRDLEMLEGVAEAG